jgi:serine/threonine protein kinase/tetratricopeptide (TPR) repeat protein
MHELPEDRDPLEVLAAEFIERQRTGPPPSISEYAAAHPELAAEIRDFFPTIVAMERLKVHREEASGARVSLGALKLDRLGDFRILGEIGRGGMGIVYEAFQESLGRHVAVKVLPRQLLLQPTQLQRFQREAQTAARLHHTNIVPVFGVGEQDGFHYIVMQLIRGVGLDAVLVDLQQQGLAETEGLRAPEPPVPRPVRSRPSEVAEIVRMLVEGQAPAAEPFAGEGTAADRDEPPAVNTPTEDFVHGRDSTPQVPARPSPRASVPGARPSRRFGPAYWRSAADLARQAAEALHYAHLHHTLHRDIKPANLLVDRQGIVWIGDFGLAKAMEQDHVTQTGGLVGTLRYMAPEQFSGRVDARSDIYSLGLTLYELLTLRPGFDDASRSSLIGQITQGEPVRPRKVNADIPRDLETITLKAIARDPEHRYQSAGDLAHDLQCYLEDRPILARRASVVERLWRWSRRNRVVTALAASTLLLLMATVVLLGLGYVASRHAEREAERLRHKAEATSALALEALDNIFQQFAPDRNAAATKLSMVGETGEEIAVPVQPVLSKEAAAMLEHMLAFYDRLAEQSGADGELRRKAAEANRRVGDIRQRLGHYEESKRAYLRAIEAYRQLIPVGPQGIELATEIARTQNELGNVYGALRQLEESQKAYRSALATLLARSPSTAPRYQFELARTYYLLGKRPGNEPGPPPIALGRQFPWPRGGHGGRGHAGGPHGPRDPEFGPPHRHGLKPEGKEPPGPGGPHPPFDLLDPQAQQQNLNKAIGLLERLVAEHPAVPDYRHLLALCYRELRPPRPEEDSTQVAEALNKATAILQKLADEHPDVPDYRQDLCETYAMLDVERSFSPGAADKEAARRSQTMIERGLAISEELVAEHPNVPDYAITQVYLRLRLAGLLAESDPAGAESSLRKAMELQSTLVRRFPTTRSYSFWMAVVQEWLGQLLQNRGRLAESRDMQLASLAALEKAIQGDSHADRARWLLAYKYSCLADLLRQMKDESGAADAQHQAEALRGVP